MKVNDRQQRALVKAVEEAKQALANHHSYRRIVKDSELSTETWRKLTSPVVDEDGTNGYEIPTLEQASVELRLWPGALFEVAYNARRLRDSDFAS